MTESNTQRVGPPVTVVEDETEDDYEEEPWSWKMKSSTRPVSPPIHNVIDSFNKELDQLTKSLDEAVAFQEQQQQRPWASSNGKSHQDDFSSPLPIQNHRSSSTSHYSSYSSSKISPSRLKDPPTTTKKAPPVGSSGRVSPVGTYQHGTPVHAKNLRPPPTPAEPPPDPVQTPILGTPATPARGRRNDDKRSGVRSSTIKERQLYKQSLDDQDPSWRDTLEKMRQTLSLQDERIRDLEYENEDLRQQLNAQKQELLLEGEPRRMQGRFGEEPSSTRRSYREESKYHPQGLMGDASVNRSYRTDPQVYREDPSVQGEVAATPTYQAYPEDSAAHRGLREQPSITRGYRIEPRVYSREDSNVHQIIGERPTPHQTSDRREPMGRLQSAASTGSSPYRSFQSPARIRSPPRRIHMGSVATTTVGESVFSPGTCFVGELARLMTMEEGHHAPLSVILDKHWDQLRNHFQTEGL